MQTSFLSLKLSVTLFKFRLFIHSLCPQCPVDIIKDKHATDDYKIRFLYFSVKELQLHCKSAANLYDRQYLGFFPSHPQLLETPVRRVRQVGPPGRAEIATTTGQHPEALASMRGATARRRTCLSSSMETNCCEGQTDSNLRDDRRSFPRDQRSLGRAGSNGQSPWDD